MDITKFQAALEEIATERQRLDRWESQLRAMVTTLSGEALPVAPSRPSVNAPKAKGKRGRPQEGETAIEKMASLVRAAGRPLHITMLATKLSELAGREIKRSSIEPGLIRHIAHVKEPLLKKVAPSTYGLPEWGSQQASLLSVAS